LISCTHDKRYSSFAKEYPDEQILQEVLAKLTWYHHITLLEKIKEKDERLLGSTLLCPDLHSDTYCILVKMLYN
jgi:predicted nuclease of restriction endonuclease-like (RecB) superfamily